MAGEKMKQKEANKKQEAYRPVFFQDGEKGWGDKQKLKSWYDELQGNNKDRAYLRRSVSPLQATVNVSAWRLAEFFPDLNAVPEIPATLAAILAHVKEDGARWSGKAFPEELATPAQGKSASPVMNESRFGKLLTCRNWEEFFTAMRRAVQMNGDGAHIPSLVDGIILWGIEHTVRQSENGKREWAEEQLSKLRSRHSIVHGFVFEWSRYYFSQVLQNENQSSPKQKKKE